jgi:hypothetical protein
MGTAGVIPAEFQASIAKAGIFTRLISTDQACETATIALEGAVAGHAARIMRKSSENGPRLVDKGVTFDEELIPDLFVLRLHIGSPLELLTFDSYVSRSLGNLLLDKVQSDRRLDCKTIFHQD